MVRSAGNRAGEYGESIVSFYSKARGLMSKAVAAIKRPFQYDHKIDIPAKYVLPDPVLPVASKIKFRTRRGKTHNASGARLTVKWPADGVRPW